MENQDIRVLRALLHWRRAGQHALLATVVRTWGSSPRPVGSLMALCETGALVGSVSGGCVEDDLIRRYATASAPPANGAPSRPDRVPTSGLPQWLRYGVSADEAHRFGLPCGGTLELLLEPDPALQPLADLLDRLADGALVERSIDLRTGQVSLAPADTPQALEVRQGPDGQAECMRQVFGPAYRLLIIGAGALAESLAAMAVPCGFAVTVCDPREEYRQAAVLPQVALSTDMPDDAVTRFRPDRRSAIVALSHDPKLDDLALLEAMHTEAFYIGAIGSRRNDAARRQRLREHFGATEAQLARLHGPIGLYIGSKTPPEIAVSVMAEILAKRHGVLIPEDWQVGPAKNRLGSTQEPSGEAACGLPAAPHAAQR